jgi:hypothetical protein
MYRILKLSLCVGTILLALCETATAQDCPAGALAKPKSSAMYLVYTSSDDASFPSYGPSPQITSPLADFDISELDATIGTEAQLRNRTQELVEDGYCEFDVEIKTVTSLPASPPETRWQIVGIGSDSTGTGLVGRAQAVDTGDSDSQDYARFWVGSLATFAGTELQGANSTLERWSVGLANLIAHESGHNYGGAHGNGVAIAGEDATVNHYMTNPALGANSSSVIDSFNHFSDTTYEVLGHNIGLNIKTLNNWDFTNPNDSNADSLTITLLSKATSLNIGWSYNGSLSPWTSPTIVNTGGTQTFRGESYTVYELRFMTAKSWSGGSNGEAPPGEKFHVGASFTESDTVIVYETTLHAGGSDLALHPRMIGYDAGTADDGSFSMTFFNPSPEDGFLAVQDVQVLFVPRMIDIESMVTGGKPVGINGLPVTPFGRAFPLRGVGEKEQGGSAHISKEPVKLDLAKLIDKRHIDVFYDPKDCPNQPGSVPGNTGPSFGFPNSPDYCQDGTALSLFPATYTYVIATVVDPNAKHWDQNTGAFTNGPLESKLFFQVAGIVPDFNDNGIDDLLDIRTGTSVDENGNGVPDEAETPQQDEKKDFPWLLMVILLVLLILAVIIYLLKRKTA